MAPLEPTDPTARGDESAEFVAMPPGAEYSPRYPMALAYAAAQHSAQHRKDDQGTPYVVHLLAVSRGVLLHGWGDPRTRPEIEDLAIAALLHDLAEDHGGEAKLTEIEAMFGPRVAEVVRIASDSLAPDATDKAPWRQRKEDHIARLGALAARGSDGQPRDAGACLVVACDKLDNLTQTVEAVALHGEGYLERFKGRAEGTRWYYRSMIAAMRPALVPGLAAALTRQLELLEG